MSMDSNAEQVLVVAADDLQFARKVCEQFYRNCQTGNEADLEMALRYMITAWDDPTTVRNRLKELCNL